MPPARLNVRVARDIAQIAAAEWDACANPPDPSEPEAGGERFNPFISHAFLLALEQSRSVGGRSGWAPTHVLVEDEAGRLLAAAPTYIKSHSQGEYVFDHGWAQAYAQAGGRYYPKLQVAVPFTPATGRRLLVAPGAPAGRARDLDRRTARPVQGDQRLLDPCHLRQRRGLRGPVGGRFLPAHRRAVSLRQSGLSRLRGIPRSAFLAQAQEHQARAQGCAGRRHRHRMDHRRGAEEASTGTRSSRSTWIPGLANGAIPI